MHDWLVAIILGVVEGLTEFLPVSSTAHLRLTQALLGVDLHSGYWKMFAVVVQLPAILAVVIYFRERLFAFVVSFFAKKPRWSDYLFHPLSLVGITTIVTGVPAMLAKKLIKHNLESLYVMGVALITGGVIMWIVDAWAQRRATPGEAMPAPLPQSLGDTPTAPASFESEAKPTGSVQHIEQMNPLQAIVIGAAQILAAIFPGTSRSMSTIAAGQLMGLSRPVALEFSFFASIPLMLAACVFDLKESLRAPAGEPAHIEGGMTASRWMALGVGSLVSFVTAYLVIAWFMAWVRRRGFTPFAIYRILAGAAVITWAMGR